MEIRLCGSGVKGFALKVFETFCYKVYK